MSKAFVPGFTDFLDAMAEFASQQRSAFSIAVEVADGEKSFKYNISYGPEGLKTTKTSSPEFLAEEGAE